MLLSKTLVFLPLLTHEGDIRDATSAVQSRKGSPTPVGPTSKRKTHVPAELRQAIGQDELSHAPDCL
jgi:hypothetical protein